MVLREKVLWLVLEPAYRTCSRISLGEWNLLEMKEEIVLHPFGFSQMHLEYTYRVEAVHIRINLPN